MLSVGHCGEESRQTGKIGRVVDAQEIVENEIWKITYCSTTSTHTFYVLQDTCEVIGESTTSSITSISLQPQTNLRMDWAAYIETVATRNTDAGRISLSKRLHWTNHEEYEHGISKIWLKRIQGEGETGSEKLKIATRYIFACVIGNRQGDVKLDLCCALSRLFTASVVPGAQQMKWHRSLMVDRQ